MVKEGNTYWRDRLQLFCEAYSMSAHASVAHIYSDQEVYPLPDQESLQFPSHK